MNKTAIALAVLIVFGTGCPVATIPNSNCLLASNLSTRTSGKELGIGITSLGGTSVVQPFIVHTSGTVTHVSVLLQRIGTFTQGVQTVGLTIEGNTLAGTHVGSPTGVAAGSVVELDVSRITSDGMKLYTFKLNSEVSLSNSQVYWLRLRASYPVNNTDYIAWGAHDGLANGYSVGDVKLNAMYETEGSSGNYSTASIGTNRFMIFNVGCTN